MTRWTHTRTFTDRDAVLWTVSEERDDPPPAAERRERRDEPRSKGRAAARGHFATRGLGLPFLCFVSRHARRRVDRFPADWMNLPEDELEDLLGESAPG